MSKITETKTYDAIDFIASINEYSDFIKLKYSPEEVMVSPTLKIKLSESSIYLNENKLSYKVASKLNSVFINKVKASEKSIFNNLGSLIDDAITNKNNDEELYFSINTYNEFIEWYFNEGFSSYKISNGLIDNGSGFIKYNIVDDSKNLFIIKGFIDNINTEIKEDISLINTKKNNVSSSMCFFEVSIKFDINEFINYVVRSEEYVK